MPSVNDVLMGRARVAPTGVKRKRSASSASSASSAASATRSSASPLLKAQRASPFASPSATQPVKPPAAPQQTYIDVGQRSFGEQSTCRTCGLLYTVGEEEDEKEHAAFCKRVRRGITVSRWKNERLLKEFPDTNARIIELRAGDPAAHVNKLREVKALLDDALGFVDEDEFRQRGVFLYVSNKQVVGCVTVEGITHAVPVVTDASKDTEAASKPALVGVSQMWVHPAFRRRRIAWRLLDAARDKFIYGMRVPLYAVAFAQPTTDGLELAAAYVSPGPVLVYGSAA